MSETIWDAYDDLAASLNKALLLLQEVEESLSDDPGDASVLHDATLLRGKVEQFLSCFSRRVSK